ncbi:hypothetical protein F9C07_2132340 [Aspergillus flavus]|uniref:Uncharacterized protein n=5 Tax=Aspergillus subgen. Circumdati TaxID=2720871 RepID=A0A7U2MG04_ASPFN|nr:uncharacterized protein G4B84_003828 [Aspergillus flavus NRRL3357]EIT80872.1 hypothetical protein Ao3042_02614 [Aspergillus oryzae 3.042]KAB8242694.1 hypothetical protein BDV35DRAFT_396497 [Aspergillus flavus]KDE79103.1 hypothetical protein AO1008_05662 [Aspergillus oryzae 100-8]KJJ34019.1 hypothetical protein AFLA70_33g003980 [Aspergillus flavus AF70]OOO09859.1 hypothetical protein OAory_01056670 [Aspergillus oryzae]GMG52509.1 unnamed protein product [Aspergillus oryzae var. brunneus]|eukprot:EIT80872.1 hypothetical protein Ao3042_02614 [Aspergillus oryzae 3.042]
MPALEVPVSGLSLCRDNPGSDSTVKPTQIMRLNLAQNTLDELIQTLRDDQTARVRLGKHPTLYYGSKSQSFHSHPETHRSEIYSSSSNDKENLYFTGVLSHSLEVQKAKEATAATDQALANLEQSLNAFERGKESKKTHIITSIDEVRALRAGDKRQAALLARKSSSKVELEKDRLLKNATNRSVSSSPALGVSLSPTSAHPLTPTSAPLSQNKDRVRLDALKVPFIHLLAVRAVSAKFLARQTRSSIEDCTALARKYGAENRINPEKFDLKDKAYRELDVWKFPYPSQEERQEAIENAISAFDRMRISRTDKLWQMLLPKEERGKGKCLSRLNLRTGPVKKPQTPRIQVQNSDENGKDGDTTGPDTDRVSGNALTPKAQPTSAPRSGANAQKKRIGNSAAKQSTTKGKNTTNSTLTGRVTKKPERKPVPKPDGKFKSAEFVHDSDEDDTDMPDVSASEQPLSEKTKPQPKAPPKPVESSTPRESSHVPTPKIDQPERPAPKAEPSPPNPPKPTTSSKRPPSSRPPAQKSPQKPSPLGSSPPTNASDLQSRSRSSSQNNSSSSSSSPLITQISKPNKATGTSNVKKQMKANGVVKATPALNPLKRKAELDRPSATPAQGRTTGDLEHKRRRAVSTSSGSTGSASPPLSREILLQQLREKSQRFKHYYAKYRSLHDTMAAHPDPPRAELEKLRRQHFRLQQMKEEIWDEDRRLREGL